MPQLHLHSPSPLVSFRYRYIIQKHNLQLRKLWNFVWKKKIK